MAAVGWGDEGEKRWRKEEKIMDLSGQNVSWILYFDVEVTTNTSSFGWEDTKAGIEIFNE